MLGMYGILADKPQMPYGFLTLLYNDISNPINSARATAVRASVNRAELLANPQMSRLLLEEPALVLEVQKILSTCFAELGGMSREETMRSGG
jgi:hypothetical protein